MIKYLYKKALWFGVGVIIIFVLTVLHIFSFYSHQAYEPKDCAVVFGAAVWPGYYGPVPSHALTDRTLSGADLYKDGLVNCIVLSGANSIYGAHEVDMMTDILLKEKVPINVIELDRDGVDTRATINHLDPTRSYILVSNDFHLARIGLLAQRAGLSKNGFSLHSAKYGRGSGSDGLSARYSREPYFIFREVVAWWYYFFSTVL